MKTIVLSIVSHNQEKLVNKLLLSLVSFVRCKNAHVKILITNNLPGPEWEATNFDLTIETINNVVPKGFGENHNYAYSKHESDVFIVVNPDILFFEIFDLDKLIENIDGIAAPVIFDKNMIIEDFIRKDLSLINIVSRRLFKAEKVTFENFDWVAGMFMIFQSQVFHELKGFDEDFFMYVEDCDICMRARQLNVPIKILDSHNVIHDARRSSNKSLRFMLIHIRSLLVYWWKKVLGK